MLNVENVATPLTASTLVVRAGAPPRGFARTPPVISPVYPVTVFPEASRAVTCTADIVCPACVVCGCVVKARFVAGGAGVLELAHVVPVGPVGPAALGSAVRRVVKVCRSRWAPHH